PRAEDAAHRSGADDRDPHWHAIVQLVPLPVMVSRFWRVHGVVGQGRRERPYQQIRARLRTPPGGTGRRQKCPDYRWEGHYSSGVNHLPPAMNPPSTMKVWPVMKEPASEASSWHMPTSSDGRPGRFIGTRFMIQRDTSGSAQTGAASGVSM